MMPEPTTAASRNAVPKHFGDGALRKRRHQVGSAAFAVAPCIWPMSRSFVAGSADRASAAAAP